MCELKSLILFFRGKKKNIFNYYILDLFNNFYFKIIIFIFMNEFEIFVIC